MKKTIIAISVAVFLAFPGIVLGQGSQGVQQQNKVQDPTTHTATPQANQNQFQIQNKGENTQLRTTTQFMQQLMSMEGLEEEVGNKVQALAQEQMQAQNQIQTQLNKLESKSSFMKKIFGPDYGAIKNLKQQTEQNRLRIQQLTQLANQVQNKGDETQLQEAIQAMTEQNTTLQEQIQVEEKVGSIFGWLVKLFN